MEKLTWARLSNSTTPMPTIDDNTKCFLSNVSGSALLRIEPVYDGSGTSVTTYRLVDENGNILMIADKATCEWCKEHGC